RELTTVPAAPLVLVAPAPPEADALSSVDPQPDATNTTTTAASESVIRLDCPARPDFMER
ncbi:MAG TPA: hypothetical protein VFQ61_38865, partial [Polyangiaceae bacterium]|nr:hypothetical protein [Polyangiaceae bacterium]